MKLSKDISWRVTFASMILNCVFTLSLCFVVYHAYRPDNVAVVHEEYSHVSRDQLKLILDSYDSSLLSDRITAARRMRDFLSGSECLGIAIQLLDRSCSSEFPASDIGVACTIISSMNIESDATAIVLANYLNDQRMGVTSSRTGDGIFGVQRGNGSVGPVAEVVKAKLVDYYKVNVSELTDDWIGVIMK